MRVRAALLFAAASGAASCALPVRDNPRDPAIAPVARLEIVDAGPGSACPPAAFATEYNAVGEASRGRCLALDARRSTDPQGNGDIREYRFSLPAGVGFEARTVTSTSGILVLDPAYRRSLPTDVWTHFGLRVRDRDGNHGDGAGRVILRNEAPIASIAHGYSLPLGGFPWAPGAPMSVIFDAGASTDPDGDPLRYCWKPPQGTESCSLGDAGKTYTLAGIPPSHGRHVVELRIKDAEQGESEDGNSAVSRTARASVWVEAPGLWKTPSLSDASSVVRLSHEDFPVIEPSAVNATLLEGPAGPVIVVEVPTPSPRLRARTYSSFSAGPDSVYAPGTPAAKRILPDPPRSRVWILRDEGETYRVDAFRVDASLTLTPLGSTSALSVPEVRGVHFAVAGDGSAWIGSGSGQALLSLASPGAAAFDQAIEGVPLALSARPGSSEMWVLVQDASTVSIRRFAAAGAPGEHVDLGPLAASGLQWIDHNELWLLTLEFGLLRVNAARLLDGLASGLDGQAALLLATTAVVDVSEQTGEMVLDPTTGEAWLATSRIAPDLSVHVGGKPAFIDRDGYPWTVNGGLRRTRALDSGRTLEALDIAGGARHPSIDLTTGSLWVQRSSDEALTEITSEGRPGRRIPVIDLPGSGPGLVPDFEELVVSPAGGRAYAVEQIGSTYSVLDIDLTGNPPAAREIAFYDGGATGVYLYSYAGFFPSASAATPFVWTAASDPDELYPVRIDENGPRRDTGVAVSSSLGGRLGMARSLADDGLCIATLENAFLAGTTYQLTIGLFRALPGQAAVLLEGLQFTYTNPGGASSVTYDLPFVAATRAPAGGEMCWTGYLEHASSPGGVQTHSLLGFGAGVGTGTLRLFAQPSTTEDIRGIVPTSPDDVWYLRGPYLVHRFAPDEGGVLVMETLTGQTPISSTSSLVNAESKSYD